MRWTGWWAVKKYGQRGIADARNARLAGTIEVGKVADLVLLDANPHADIRNTSRTVAVVANGRLFLVRRDREGRFSALHPVPP